MPDHEAPTQPEQEQPNLEGQLTEQQAQAITTLTPEDRAQLSKVLFPDTHTDKVRVLSRERVLRPLPIKYARQLHELLRPISEKIAQAFKATAATRIDEDLVSGLLATAKVLAQYYAWEDVSKAADEEELNMSEVQELARVQSDLNGANDFLLGPLRIVVRTLQVHEVVQVKFQNMFLTPASSIPGPVPLTS